MKKTEVQNNKKFRINKVAKVVILLALLVTLCTSGLIAYFSDLTFEEKNANVGTLRINGDYSFYVNGESVGIDGIQNLNPGDVIVIKASINNLGNKSAWIREKIKLITDQSILQYFVIYEGEYTKSELKGNGSIENLELIDGTSVSPSKIINGSGTAAEVEDGIEKSIQDSSYEVFYTIYFLPTAPNAAQGKTINFTISTQALQYRNNEDEPDDEAWGTVVSVN